jgi:hypothetical protein
MARLVQSARQVLARYHAAMLVHHRSELVALLLVSAQQHHAAIREHLLQQILANLSAHLPMLLVIPGRATMPVLHYRYHPLRHRATNLVHLA